MKSFLGRNLQDRLFSKLRFGLRFFLPIAIFLVVVFLDLPALAYILIILSKWRIFIKHPKLWWFNMKINSVDLIVGGSIVYFMSWPDLLLWQQIIWLAFHLIWVLYLRTIKKHNGYLIQALVAQTLGVSAISYNLYQFDASVLLILTWFISLFSAYHFFNGLEEKKYQPYLVYMWGLFSVQLSWILLHWQINFYFIPRLALIQTILFISLAVLHTKHIQQNHLKTCLNKF